MNQHANIIARVSASVLSDIEGLDADACGFCRAGCAVLPDSLPKSFEPLLNHIFQSSKIPPTEWNNTATNVPGYEAASKLLKASTDFPQAKLTAFYNPSAEPHHLVMRYRPDTSDVSITTFTGVPEGELPLPTTKGVIATDRSDETFLFVCSHRRRDDRCGYCGPVLVDLLQKSLFEKLGGDAEKFPVLPCSHIGGHTYAGNVLLYSKAGGMCFGCVTPQDVDLLTSYVISQKSGGVLPPELGAKVRGTMDAKQA